MPEFLKFIAVYASLTGIIVVTVGALLESM